MNGLTGGHWWATCPPVSFWEGRIVEAIIRLSTVFGVKSDESSRGDPAAKSQHAAQRRSTKHRFSIFKVARLVWRVREGNWLAV